MNSSKTRNSALQLALMLLVAMSCGGVHAVPINGLYATGVDDAGALLPIHARDQHYTLSTNFDPGINEAFVGSPLPWPANNSSSQWIGPGLNLRGDFADPPGNFYTYSIRFDLTGFDLSTVVVNVAGQSDNVGQIFLNGAYTSRNLRHHFENEASVLTNTNVLTSGFISGVNTLEFRVNNQTVSGTNPTGLNILRLDGTGELMAMQTTVPEPGSIGLAGLALSGLLFARRRS